MQANLQEEFSWGDDKTALLIKNLIEKMIDKKLKNLRYNKMIPAKVINVGSGVADVILYDAVSSTPTLTSVKIRDGITLISNDEVYLTAINGSLNNLFIDVKK